MLKKCTEVAILKSLMATAYMNNKKLPLTLILIIEGFELLSYAGYAHSISLLDLYRVLN